MWHLYLLACACVVAGRPIAKTPWDFAEERLTNSTSHTVHHLPKTLGAHSQPFYINQKHSPLSETREIVKWIDDFATADGSAHLVNRDTKVTSKEFMFTLSMSTEDLFPSETESVVSKSLFPVFRTNMPHRPETLALTGTFEPIPTATFHIPKSITVPTIIITRPSTTSLITTIASILLPKAPASSAAPSLVDSDAGPDLDTPPKGEIASIVLGVISIFLSMIILSYLCGRCVDRYKKRTRPKPFNPQLKGFPYPDPRLSPSYTAIASPRDSQNEYLPHKEPHMATFSSKPGHQISYTSAGLLENEGSPDLARCAATQDNTLVPSETGARKCKPTGPRGYNEGTNHLSRYSSSVYSQDGDWRSHVESPYEHRP